MYWSRGVENQESVMLTTTAMIPTSFLEGKFVKMLRTAILAHLHNGRLQQLKIQLFHMGAS